MSNETLARADSSSRRRSADVSRITSGKLILRLERTEQLGAVQAAIETARPQFDTAQQVLELELPSVQIWLKADVFWICQIVNRLVTNTAEYSSDGKRSRLDVRREGKEAAVLTRPEAPGGTPPPCLAGAKPAL